MITMTVAEALEKQAEQIEWYAKAWNMPVDKVRSVVAEKTTAYKLNSTCGYDIVTINRHIPRGAAIEALFGRLQINHD